MAPLQAVQNQPLQFIQQRPQRAFNEGAASTAVRVTGIVLTILAAIVSFLTLPWAAALAITGGVGLLALICCNCSCPQNPQRAAFAQDDLPLMGVGYAAPRPRWYQRTMPFFLPHNRGVHVADHRAREEVGIGQHGFVNPPPYMHPLPFRREVPPPDAGFRERPRDAFRGTFDERPPLMRMGGRAEHEHVGMADGGRREPFFRAPGPEMTFGPPAGRPMGGLGGGVEREVVGAAGGGRRG